jgi:glycosyltransferase involved in cell wall biosynthesis
MFSIISIVIPARNEASRISRLIRTILLQCPAGSELEIIVADDGSSDDTAAQAAQAGATVIAVPAAHGGNPAIARNLGAAASKGDPIIFLDADCMPQEGWLAALLARHAQGYEVFGGALALPTGLSPSARCDYYCGWYHVHPKYPAGIVTQHPPCNLSVRRTAFLSTGGFFEKQPIAYAHEELAWQAELQRRGGRIYFEPQASAGHHNRPGFGNLLRRNYRWGYSAIEAKATVGITRLAWLYRHPWLVIMLSPPLALVSTFYLIYRWLRAGMIEPLLMLPAVLAARIAYAAGMVAGGLDYARPDTSLSERRPRWE